MDYSEYRELHVRRLEPGILEIVMGEEGGKLSITTARMHGEMARIWLDIDRDPETRVAILRGAGRGFSAGGDLAMVEEMTRDFAVRGARLARGQGPGLQPDQLLKDDRLRHGTVRRSARASSAGCSRTSRLREERAHHRRPHPARRRRRDHAAIIWPLLCGMAKAKYYLLLCEQISGEEAERLGLVSLTCEESELQAKALEVARKLAAGAQTALRWTKYSLNNWLRMAGPAFDASLALEVLGFTGPEAKEGHGLASGEACAALPAGAAGLLNCVCAGVA